MEGDECTNPQPDEDMCASASCLGTELLQGAGVPAYAFLEKILEGVNVLREVYA